MSRLEKSLSSSLYSTLLELHPEKVRELYEEFPVEVQEEVVKCLLEHERDTVQAVSRDPDSGFWAKRLRTIRYIKVAIDCP